MVKALLARKPILIYRFLVQKHRILSTSDSLLIHTGYGKVCRDLFSRLAYDPRFECFHAGWQMVGDDISYHAGNNMLSPKLENSIRLLSASGRHPNGADTLQPYIKMIQPDITFILADTFMFYPWIQNIDFTPSHSIFYFPSDGAPLPVMCENVLKKVEYPIAMAKWGQKQVLDNYGIDAKYIPHAIDSTFLTPVMEDKKQMLRQQWSQRLGINLIGKFVAIYVGRNQGRKMPGELLKCFAEFARDKKDVVLLLHCDPSDPAGMGPEGAMNDFIRSLKIEDKVRLTGTTYWRGFSDGEMKDLYQLSDVYVSTSTGEGFGIPIIESMSCGLPVIFPNFTTPEELLGNNEAGIRVPLYNHDDNYNLRGTMVGTWNVERGMVDKRKFVEALNTLYLDEKLRKKMGKFGRKKVEQEYSWDGPAGVYNQWLKLFTEIVER